MKNFLSSSFKSKSQPHTGISKIAICEINYTVHNFFYLSDKFLCPEPLRSIFFFFFFSSHSHFIIKRDRISQKKIVFLFFSGQQNIFLFLTSSRPKTIQIIIISFHIIFHSIIFLYRNYSTSPFPFLKLYFLFLSKFLFVISICFLFFWSMILIESNQAAWPKQKKHHCLKTVSHHLLKCFLTPHTEFLQN